MCTTDVYGWSYDGVGNRTGETLAQPGGMLLSKNYTYAATSNRLQSVSGSENRNFSYGSAGQVQSDDRDGANDLTFGYDQSGRLTQVATLWGPVQRSLYDPWGRRVMRVTGEETRFYHYDEDDRLIAVSDGAGATLVEWVWLPDPTGGPALPVLQIEGGQIYAVHADHLGQPQKLTNNAGAVVWDRQAHPFGATLAEMGTIASQLRFPGQLTDPATATHYNMARDYDPTLGRYLQSDPIGLAGGWNTYAYVGGNPISAVDPDGQIALPIVGALLGAGGDLAMQLVLNGGRLGCVSWMQVGAAGAVGAVGGGWLQGSFGLAKGSWKWGNVRRRYRRLHSTPRGHDVHHWGIERRGWLGKKLPDRIVNHPANLTPIDRLTHQRIHNEYGVAQRWWHGTPPWAKSAEISIGGGAAVANASDCDCK